MSTDKHTATAREIVYRYKTASPSMNGLDALIGPITQALRANEAEAETHANFIAKSYQDEIEKLKAEKLSAALLLPEYDDVRADAEEMDEENNGPVHGAMRAYNFIRANSRAITLDVSDDEIEKEWREVGYDGKCEAEWPAFKLGFLMCLTRQKGGAC